MPRSAMRLQTKVTLGVGLIVGVTIAAAAGINYLALRHPQSAPPQAAPRTPHSGAGPGEEGALGGACAGPWGRSWMSSKGSSWSWARSRCCSQTGLGVRTGVQRLGVPGQAVRKLLEGEQALKTWDAKTFRVAQEFRQVAVGPSEIPFEYFHCPPAFCTMRQVARAQLDRLPAEPYGRSLGMPLGDFLCASCRFCRSEMVGRLTGGACQVRDVESHLKSPATGRGVCRFRVERRAEAAGARPPGETIG